LGRLCNTSMNKKSKNQMVLNMDYGNLLSHILPMDLVLNYSLILFVFMLGYFG
jgi:hypothetical protein